MKEDDSTHVCSICGDSTEHEWVYDATDTKNDTQHTVKCEGCGETKFVDHTYDQDGNKCVCGQAEPINYGSEAAPLSVTQALALAEKQCLSNSDYTEQIVVATGIVTNQPTDSGSYLKDITLRDVNDEGKTIHINTLNINDGVDKPDQNDTITIKGYIRKLNDVIEFGSKSSTYVYTVKNQRGQSSIEEGAHDGASISGLTEQPKVTNGTEIEFTVEPLDGKKVTDVKVNGTSILSSVHETNKYSFTVHGNATVTVETADEGTEEVAYYKKITKLTDLVDGGKYLIVSDGDNLIFDGSLGTLDAEGNKVDVTIEDGQIEATEAIMKQYFTITKNGDGYLVQSASGYYIYSTANKNQLLSSKTTKTNNTIEFDATGSVLIKGTLGTVLRYNNATSNGTRFRYYKSDSYAKQQPVYLYLLSE